MRCKYTIQNSNGDNCDKDDNDNDKLDPIMATCDVLSLVLKIFHQFLETNKRSLPSTLQLVNALDEQ